MTKKSNLINETLMYSVDKAGNVVVHHLPYARGNPLLEIYTAKGFVYERPPSNQEIIAVKNMLDEADVPNDGHRMLMLTDDKGTHIIEQGKTPDEAGRIALKSFGKELERTKRKYHKRRRKVKA